MYVNGILKVFLDAFKHNMKPTQIRLIPLTYYTVTSSTTEMEVTFTTDCNTYSVDVEVVTVISVPSEKNDGIPFFP